MAALTSAVDYGPFPSKPPCGSSGDSLRPLTLRPGDLLTVTLPDGQTVEIDARYPAAVVVCHLDSAGDHVASLDVDPEPDASPHPSLSAAERNPSMV